jgi:hypothetical protein
LLLVALPILLAVIFLGRSDILQRYLVAKPSEKVSQQKEYQSIEKSDPTSATTPRYCSHCGGSLQPDWTHCPQCGAPI